MNSDDNTKPFNRITYDALQYIDKHIYESVKIDQIAKCLHVSRSYLNHVFRADLNIPIHTYILKKKLVAAHQQINMGASPTEVAQKYGFLDYSGFYKQYVKMFGITPSNRKKAGMH